MTVHEAGIARQLLTAVLERADAVRATRVRVVRGWVAESEHLSPESLALHFRAHAQGTAAEHARLELAMIRVSARCAACGRTYEPDHRVLLCPACGSADGAFLGPTGIGLDTLEVDAP
jgi:hydrogenase nickel incorporation protein HypA/HybF